MYYIQNINLLPEDKTSQANAINSAGRVVGFSSRNGDLSEPRRAFSWKNGVITDLSAMLPGAWTSEATGINSGGDIVGFWSAADAQEEAPEHAFLLRGGKVYDLPPLTVGDECRASAINDDGIVVGGSGELYMPVIWTDPAKQPQELGVDVQNLRAVGGGPSGINKAMIIVGGLQFGDDSERAVSWSALKPNESILLDPLDLVRHSHGFAINRDGHAAGDVGDLAALWPNGSQHRTLGPLFGDASSFARGINNPVPGSGA